MDPVNARSDEELWMALDRAHIGQVIRQHPEQLDMQLQNNGSPLSTGQVQLLSLARAIARNTKVDSFEIRFSSGFRFWFWMKQRQMWTSTLMH